MKKIFPCWAILSFFVTLFFGVAAWADEPPLPYGLHWGDSRERCIELLVAGGYSTVVRAEDYAASKSPDRTLKRIREVQGISTVDFEKKDDAVEKNLKIYLYQDNLFQITVEYEDTRKEFADKLVNDISQRVSLTPRLITGKDSKMDIYIWAFPMTAIVFSSRYGKAIPIPFALLEYRNEPVLNDLKDRGLM